MEQGLNEIFAAKGIKFYVARQGSAFCAYFMDHAPRDFHDILVNHDFAFDQLYRRKLIEKGIFHFPLPIKQGSISYAHTDEDIAITLEKTKEVVNSL